jgi:tRNA modification GTPase
MDISDTIAAVATPPGRGGIGIIRVSGRGALEAMQRLFISRIKYATPEPNKLYYGNIIDLQSNIIDTGYAVFMQAPYSYTGEDTVEFQCHGSPAVLSRIMLALNESGIRTAGPGEFTRRAFLNGKIDLLQAEAVLDLVNSENETASRLALSQLKGELSEKINRVKHDLIKILSILDAIIDFPESIDEQLDIKEAEKALDEIKTGITTLLSSYRTGRVLREGLLFLITGRPNTGKSSLFNAILGRDRAIVHSTPGTTRDYIEEEIHLNGILARIVDSAGIWEPGDEIEEESIRRTLKKFEEADAYLLVIDCSQKLTDQDIKLINKMKGRRGIVVLNKTDLTNVVKTDEITRLMPEWKVIHTSAKTMNGISTLKRSLRDLSIELTPHFESGVITRARHYEYLKETLNQIVNAIDTLRNTKNIVLVSDEVRRALRHLGELTGEELSEAVLDRIFSEFCVGK